MHWTIGNKKHHRHIFGSVVIMTLHKQPYASVKKKMKFSFMGEPAYFIHDKLALFIVIAYSKSPAN